MERSLKNTTIFHVDVNSAYLSWSAVDLLRRDPDAQDLRLIPSAIGGDVERRHGVILAKSIPAKKYNVVTGEPVMTALRKCPDLVLVKPDFRIYNECSRQFIAILMDYSPKVEQVSIDEAFVDMTGTHLLYKDPVTVAYEIKDRIRNELGFTVNVGISDRKLLAKMASDFSKPDKVHTLYPDEIEDKMWPLPVRDMFGIGKSTSAQLEQMGLRTIGDVARSDPEMLIRKFGRKSGTYIYNSVNGNIVSSVDTEPEERKSYGNSTTLSEDLTTENTGTILAPTLMTLSDSVASRMRRDGAKGITVAVQLRTSQFVNHSKQDTLEKATNGTDEIYRMSKKLFNELWDGKAPVRLIGVTVSNIQDDEVEQFSLFSEGSSDKDTKRNEEIDRATDDIRKRFGRHSIMRGSVLNKKELEEIGSKQND